MAATIQMNTRISKALKQSGDAVLERNGYTPSSAVRALWLYLSEHGTLPSFMPKAKNAASNDERAAEIESNAGMAVRMLEDLIGKENVRRQDDELSYDELKELAWEDRGAFDD